MRVTFITPPFDLSGGQRAIATFARMLAARGHNVTAVAPAAPRPTFRQAVRSIFKPKSPVPPSRATHIEESGVPVRVLNRCRPVVAADLPAGDIVVATWWKTAEWVAALPQSCGVKAHFVQDYETWGWPPERVEASYRLPLHKIAGPRWVADLLVSRFGAKTLAVVGYGIDSKLFHAGERGRQPTPTVGFVHSNFRAKGTDISLQAIEVCKGTIPDLRVIAFGSQMPAPDLGVPLKAEFQLCVPNNMLRELYSKADAWLFGTRKEGFGLPILEAMACRTPVIGTPAGAAPELLGGGGGVLVRMEDPEDMAAAIIRICTLPDADWRAMSDAAHATAARYTWDDATDRFEAALVAAVRAGATS